MADLASNTPGVYAVALMLCVAIDLLRRLMLAVAAKWRRAFFVVRDEEAARGFAGWLAFPALALIAFIPALVIVTDVAVLMGFSPAVRLADLRFGMVLLWMPTALFLWLQVWHVMRLGGWIRVAGYCGLLVSLPLVAQIAAWLVLDGLRAAPLADLIAHLLCIGVLPFFVPVLHARVLAPLAAAAGRVPRHNWRPAFARLGMAVFAAAVAGIVFWYGHMAGARVLGTGAGIAYDPAPKFPKGPFS